MADVVPTNSYLLYLLIYAIFISVLHINYNLETVGVPHMKLSFYAGLSLIYLAIQQHLQTSTEATSSKFLYLKVVSGGFGRCPTYMFGSQQILIGLGLRLFLQVPDNI